MLNNNIFPGSSIIFHIPARLKDIRLLGFSVRSLFMNLGFNEILTAQLELALVESANNIVEHADLPKDKAHISMKFAVTNDKVVCTFIDQGKPADFILKGSKIDSHTDVETLPLSKHGLYIIYDVMDKVDYKRDNGRNVLTLVKYFS